MLISIHDSSLKRMAYMDNVVPLAMHYTDDTWRRLLKEATSTFTFKVDMLGREIEQYLTDDAYISFKYNNRQYLFNIMTITPDSGNKSIIVYCENLSLELLNETKAPIDITTSRNLLWYLNNDGLLNNAGITLGINEVSDKAAKIKLESEQTGLARLTSIANNFDAEIDFVTELNGDGTLKSMTVNFFKKYDGVSQGVGTYRRDLILEYGRNVDGIKRTIDKTDLYNAITPTGKDGLNITSLEKEEYDENGNLEFYTKKGSPNIFAPQSKARYRAQLLNDTDGWLRRNYSADGTSNVNTLYTLALNELKKHAYPAITYEVTGFYDLDIGDTVRIVDRSFTPTLIIQARVAEQSICFSDPTKNKTTFGNILALESRVSQDLTGRLKELVEQATPYRFEIVSDNGLTFKNSTGSTTLTARVHKGSNVDEVSVDSFEWLLDGVSFGGTSKSQLVNASQVTGTAVVRYNAKLGNTVIGGLEVTLQDVSDGSNGVSPTVTVNPDTSLTIVDAQGTSTTPVLKGSDGIAGKDGVGVKTTVITYAISTSGTTAPTTGWTSSVPSLVKGHYLWTKTVWTYTDNSSEIGYSVTYIAKDGNNGNDGIAGKDGVGIKKTTITYAVGTSGTTAPESGWNSQVPNVPAGQYLWTKTVWDYTDKTSETGYSVSKFGEKGDKGDRGIQGLQGPTGTQGVPGPKGADGKTQYTHIAYANSADGVTDFSTSDSNRTYIGMYVDFNINDSNTPSDYSWTLVKGADGTQGTPGKPGADGKTPYFHTAWSYSADGRDRFTTVYPNLNLGDNTKTFVGADGGNNLTGSIRIDPATKITQDGDINYLTFKPTRDGYDWFRFYLIHNPTIPNMTKVAVKPNTKYTFSVLLKGTGQHTIYAYQNWTAPNTPWVLQINLTSDWKLYTFTVTSSNVIPDRNVQFFIRSNNGTEINLKYPKVEEGSIATPYMQSASEVTTADWPSCIGQYTDFMQADSTNPSDYTWSLMRGNDGKPGADGKDGIAGKDGVGINSTTIAYAISSSGTVTPTTGWTAQVPTLVKGQYLWTKTVWNYSDATSETGYTVSYIAKDGNNGTDGIAGKDGVGIKKTTITYAVGTSGTTVPESGWNSQVPNVPDGQYLWTKTIWDYTDKTSETGYSVSKFGEKGPKGDPGIKGSDGTSGIIVSSVAPASPKTGQLWQDTSTTPQLVKKWTGASWVIWELYAQNLKADTLETLSAKIGKIYNEFEYEDTGSLNKGSITIENDIRFTTESLTNVNHPKTNIALSTNSNFTGLQVRYLPNKDVSGGHQTADYTYGGIYMQDNINGWAGNITAENVTLVPWTNLTYLSGFTTAENNPCQYRKIKNLDGSYTVQFKGQVKPVSGRFNATGEYLALQVPAVIKPSINAFGIGIPDFTNIQSARIVVLASDGRVQLMIRGNATDYVSLDVMSYTL